jgi:hypothetical protein
MAASCTSRRPVIFLSRIASFLARSGFARSAWRIFAKARTTKMLTRDRLIARSHHHATNAVHPTASPHVVFICTARELFKTFAAMIAPYSVKA